LTQLNDIQISRLSRRYAEIKGEHDHLISRLPSFDWKTFGASVKAEGEAIILTCMGHRWEATPRFVLQGDVALMEYAFHEKVRDEYQPVAHLFLEKDGNLYKKSTCEGTEWVFNIGTNTVGEQIISEILKQAAASGVFRPIA